MRLLRTPYYFHHFLGAPIEARLTGILVSHHQRCLSSKSGSAQDKKTKSIQLTTRISPHDLQVKIKKATDFVQKGHSARIAIKNTNPNDTKTPANLFKEFTSAAQDFASVGQSQSSATELVFTLKPMSAESEENENAMKESDLKPAKLHRYTGPKPKSAKS